MESFCLLRKHFRMLCLPLHLPVDGTPGLGPQPPTILLHTLHTLYLQGA